MYPVAHPLTLTPSLPLAQEAYLFQAALSELKTGSQVKLRNDSITLRSLTANLQRETDGLEQKMKEDMQRLGSDIQVRAAGVAGASGSRHWRTGDADRPPRRPAARDEHAQGRDRYRAAVARQARHGAARMSFFPEKST